MAGSLFFLDRKFPPNLTKLNDQSIVLLDRHQELLAVHLSKDQQYRLSVALAEVDPLYSLVDSV